MANNDFNRDMDEYVKRRKGSSNALFKFTFPGSKAKEPAPKKQEQPDDGDFSEEEVKMAMQGKLGDKAMPSSQPETRGGRPGIFSRIFGSSRSRDDEDVTIEESPAPPARTTGGVPPDVAEVLTLAGKWLNRLDPEVKREFKESTDYAKYKFLLERLKKQ